MRRQLSLALIFLAGMALLAQKPVSITGVVKGQPAGKVKLLGTYGSQNTLNDSTTVDAQGRVSAA